MKIHLRMKYFEEINYCYKNLRNKLFDTEVSVPSFFVSIQERIRNTYMKDSKKFDVCISSPLINVHHFYQEDRISSSS